MFQIDVAVELFANYVRKMIKLWSDVALVHFFGCHTSYTTKLDP